MKLRIAALALALALFPQLASAVVPPGEAWSFGYNYFGELGDNTTGNRNYALPVLGLSNVSAIEVTRYHSTALRNDGTVWAWGANGFGEVGDNTSTARYLPVQVTGPDGVGYLSGITSIATTRRSTIALRSDGTVWAWGWNPYGQLGDNTTTVRYAPVQVLGQDGAGYLTNMTAIAAGKGSYAVLALRNDGTVWAWGENLCGAIGDNTTTNRLTPVQVLGPNGVGYLSNITSIATSGRSSFAFRSDGTAWAWGCNAYGQLGDNTTTDSPVPVQMTVVSGIASIAAETGSTFVIENDGSLWAWGRNNYGQLGINSSDPGSHPLPVQVLGPGGAGYLTNITSVHAGDGHIIAIKNDGTAWAWGYNSWGQLGDGTNQDSALPTQVVGVTNVTAAAAGDVHSLVANTVPLITPAIPTAGKAWAFGQNNYGQLGDGTTVDKNYPVQVTGLSNISSIDSAYEHTVSLRNDGTVWAWGFNSFGALGINSSDYDAHPVPAQVVGPEGTGYLTGITKIAAARRGTLAIRNDGTVWAWGFNRWGQLGIGSSDTLPHPSPSQVLGPGGIGYLQNITAVDGGGWDYGVVALRGDGTVWTWGANSYGSLGIGSSDTLPHPSPSQVLGPGGIGYLQNITAVSSGGYHILALRSDGTVWAWGWNSYGQLGDGTTADSYVPVQVSGLANVTAIDAAYDYSLALKSDGTVWAWGWNGNGQLGINSSDYGPHPLPVQVLGSGGIGYLADVTKIAAGRENPLALKSDGTVWSWGWNFYGQLGDGTNTDSSTPVRVFGLTSMTAIAAGQYHSIAADTVPLIGPAIPGAPAGANLTIETDDNYSSADLEGDVRSGTAIVYTVNESRQYSWLQTNYANSSVGMRFLNVSFTTASTLTLQNATVAITPPSKNITYWSRAVNVTPAFNFTSYTMTFSRARPFESVFKCSSDCGNPASWAAVAGTLQDGNITVTLNETDPIIALGGSAYINVSMPSNFSATLGAPVASGAGFSIPVDPSQTYPLLSLMSLDGSYDFDFANVAPGYSSALSVAGVVPPIGPSIFGVDAWIAAINVSMDFNTSGYNVTFLGMQGKRAFKCASNCTEAASWTEVATQSAPGGMLLALAPGDPVILIGSSFGEEGGATKVAAPEADFLLVSLIFVVAVLGFVVLAGKY